MTFNLLRSLSFLIALAAFLYGTVVVSRKCRPMYFKIYLGVSVCHMLKELSMLIAYTCGDDSGNLVVVTLAVISSVFFLLSANYGQLDGIVDDGGVSVRVKLAACVAPLLILSIFSAMLAEGLPENTVQTIACGAVVVLMLPASYFNAKHLLMPDDEVGFLRSSRGCNAGALLYYFMLLLQMLADITAPQVISDAMRIAVSVSVMILVFMTERGVKRWKILISSFLSA